VALAAGMYFGFEAVRQPFDEALDEYRESQLGYPSSEPTYSSIGMRVAYYEEYWPLFLENRWIGVGTGDLIYEGRPLFEDQRFKIPFQKPHNQFLETAIKFGVLGLVLFLLIWVFAIKSFNPSFRKLGYLFSILLFVSMWSDSTLGTQGGISFFMVFTTLFLIRPNDPVIVRDEETGIDQVGQLNFSRLK
jgi:O-antigen ligase